MYKAVNERVFLSVFHHFAVIVIGVVVYVNHGMVDVSNPMSQQIHSNHRHTVFFSILGLLNVFLCIVLGSKILTET